MAVAYSAIANGGRVVTPHVGLRVEDPSGRVLQKIEPRPRRRLDISAADAVGDPLRSARGGERRRAEPRRPCSRASRSRSPGKTGTAERGAQGDQSWYVAVAPYDDPRVVVAVTVERGGFGAEAAAPAARRILAAYFGIKGKKARRQGRERTGLMASSLRMTERAPTPFGTGVQRFGRAAPALLRLDFLLLAATLGAARVQRRDARTARSRGRRDGQPGLPRRRARSSTRSVGLVADARCSRASTTRASAS